MSRVPAAVPIVSMSIGHMTVYYLDWHEGRQSENTRSGTCFGEVVE